MNFNRPLDVEPPESGHEAGPASLPPGKRRRAGLLSGVGLALVLMTALACGAWNHYAQHRQVVTTAKQSLEFVPQVRVAAVRPSTGTEVVSLPATTSAFSVANIFARASGYVDKREVDIGDRVKAGQLLAEIVAPELDHQIAQAEATLGQFKAA